MEVFIRLLDSDIVTGERIWYLVFTLKYTTQEEEEEWGSDFHFRAMPFEEEAPSISLEKSQADSITFSEYLKEWQVEGAWLIPVMPR